MNLHNSTITLTYGDRAETHHGMVMSGNASDRGFSPEELENIRHKLAEEKIDVEIIRLPSEDFKSDACVLVIRNGINSFLGDGADDKLFFEHCSLEVDKKMKDRGKVKNKRMRWNHVLGEVDIKADYENGQGTVHAFSKVPLANKLRSIFGERFGSIARDLQAEGNFYYDVVNKKKQCGISYHGDAERKVVIAVRLGVGIPIRFQWFHKCEMIGNFIDIHLNHGDIYIMSEKAIGTDWRKRNTYTLRHAAGTKDFLDDMVRKMIKKRLTKE